MLLLGQTYVNIDYTISYDNITYIEKQRITINLLVRIISISHLSNSYAIFLISVILNCRWEHFFLQPFMFYQVVDVTNQDLYVHTFFNIGSIQLILLNIYWVSFLHICNTTCFSVWKWYLGKKIDTSHCWVTCVKMLSFYLAKLYFIKQPFL